MARSIFLVALTSALTLVSAQSQAWQQCGGQGFSGSTTCVSGYSCVVVNPYYHQCQPGSSGGNPGQPTTSVRPTSTTSAGGSQPTFPSGGSGVSGTGKTTRYWDCCKPSCAWSGKGAVTRPVNTCDSNNRVISDLDARSGCEDGGSAYMCADQKPWAVSDSLAYGYAAVSIGGQTESTWCCACYELTFTSGPATGKRMIVQATNTGADLGHNHFDIAMPGGGVGIFNGCSKQYNAPTDGWGARYGGVSSRDQCSVIPDVLRSGCQWRWDWWGGSDNPDVRFREITCPAELTSKTGCRRL